ncbi:MAG: GMC family oxidoreductase, partial [Acidimicrobiia bacterium]|nr:GMC family oxidoreductase [Acidimicrobiia bacterium]
DPLAPPLIDPAYLNVDEDMETLRWGMEQARKVFETDPLASVVTEPVRPHRIPEDPTGWDAEIRRWSETLYHPAGTAALGSVVDENLAVKGVEGLIVADVSVMPSLNRGHTHAPAVMIGERAADLVLRS